MDLKPTAAPSLTIVVMPPGGRHARVRLGGELDGTTARALTEAVARALHTPAPELVELHVAALTFVDSAGVRCLLVCRAAAQDAGCRLLLAEPSRQVTGILDCTGLLDLFGLPAPSGDRPPAGRGPHHGQSVDELVARSTMTRQMAQETCARARAVRSSSPMGTPRSAGR
jgi:anti-anti-sigma factor